MKRTHRPLRGLLLAAALLAPVAEASAQAGDPSRPPRRSWTSDRRDFTVGDVITVLVDDYTSASANRGNLASESRHRDFSADVAGSGLGARIPAAGAGAGSSSVGESRQRGEAVRSSRFRGELSVRVDSVAPDGMLRVRGSKRVRMDRDRQEVTFTGWVRPQDVSRENTLDSWRVADAELLYVGKGSLGKPKSGIVTRILGWFWP